MIQLETPIFAYFRRSTKKIEQELSLENQADDIDLIIKSNGFNKHKVMFFSESRSAYGGIKIKNGEVLRKRVEFTRMLHEMDRNKQPCIILVKDSSRLSRNKKDNEEITKRLFGENGNRKVIQKIIFGNGNSWDIHSDIKAVDNELLRNYHSSVDTAEKGMTTAKGQLSRGIYSRKLAQGLSYWKRGNTILGLKQNERMPIIQKAFEMKKAGITHKKISKYLKEQGIRAGERDLNDRYFSNLIYIGEYIFRDKRTGEEIHYKNLKFHEGRTPISMALWQSVQENRGKKKDNYGQRQANFPLGEVLRTEGGRRLSGYFQKGTAQYKNTTESIHASEKWIVQEFVTFLKENIYKLVLRKRFHTKFESEIVESILDNKEFSVGSLKITGQSKIVIPLGEGLNHFFYSTAHGDYIRLTFLAQNFDDYKEAFPGKTKKDWQKFILLVSDQKKTTDTIINFYEQVFDFINNSIDDFEATLEELSLGSRKVHAVKIKARQDTKELRTDRIKKEMGDIDIEIRSLQRNFLKLGSRPGLDEAFDEELASLEKKKRILEEKLLDQDNETDFDYLISKLPDVLKRTFELSRKVLADDENEELKHDIYDLIRLTTFELKIRKKKALEIGLFGPVRQALFGENAVLEAPSGVEPDYGALQAPA